MVGEAHHLCNDGQLRLQSQADGRRMISVGIALPNYDPADFIVPTSKLDDLRKLGFSNEELFRIVAPRRTLARRKEKGEPLSSVESDRALRLERIAEHAERVFGSGEKAQRWLRSEIIALEGARPIDLLQSETGAHIVEEELIRIDFGMLA